ncbi:MAG: hypothetical protein A3H79_02030 [Candidatus Levybacteria bacterium RIFCSPLOWO2_02_FULL_36_8b]|nr:MAG: hypothetical protein A3H79_02030 [Candidatus Levybacteria bacterium RIFCSPLOWO2_02_FULL_36_8b]
MFILEKSFLLDLNASFKNLLIFMLDFFSLTINKKRLKTLITMKLYTNTINTKDIPYTTFILEKFLPNVLKSVCYNKKKLPFHEEVKKTEIGHLFEHILLEYLCRFKTSKGFKNVEFSGETYWNWRKYPRGTFYITIYAGLQIREILPTALWESSNLLKIIMESNAFLHVPTRVPQNNYIFEHSHLAIPQILLPSS